MNRQAVVIAYLVLAASLAGCQAVPSDGPLGFGGDSGSQCVRTHQNELVLVGDVVTAPAGESATILGVNLLDAQGIELTQVYLLSLSDEGGIGSSSIPPDTSAWAGRVPAKGAVIPAGTTQNIVAELRRTQSADGTSKFLEVTYRVGRKTYVDTGSTRYTLSEKCF